MLVGGQERGARVVEIVTPPAVASRDGRTARTLGLELDGA